MNTSARIKSASWGPVQHSTVAAFADASADHNPLHLDSDAAHAAGFDSVIIHGMLSMARLAKLVTDTYPLPHRLLEFEARFVAPAPLGSMISCSGETSGFSEGEAVIALEAALEDGTVIMRGSARVAE